MSCPKIIPVSREWLMRMAQRMDCLEWRLRDLLDGLDCLQAQGEAERLDKAIARAKDALSPRKRTRKHCEQLLRQALKRVDAEINHVPY